MDKQIGLGLTYHEAVDIIPYELLMLMQRDKAHVLSDDDMMEVEDEVAFFKNRG